MLDRVSRRTFVAGSAAILSARAANEVINVGFIGVGSRGYYGLERLFVGAKGLARVVAVCDTYAGYRDRAKKRVEAMGGNSPETYIDYRQMLADKSIDAVFIMTPEHLHYPMAMDAIKAGKHIYLEKPIGHTIEEGAAIVKASEASGKVLQVGTQNRSNPHYQKAKEMIEQGMIGECHYVRAFWYRNFPSGTTPAPWRYAIPADASESNTDWARFLGPAPKRPFDKNRYYQWRNYWDYSGGISTDLLVHQTDAANFVLGKTVPVSCMCSGGIYAWGAPDDREAPDTLSAIYEYADKFHLNYSCFFQNDQFGYGEQFMGHEGLIEVLNRTELHFYPQRSIAKAVPRVATREEVHVKEPMDNPSVERHVKNFLEAIKGNEKVIAPARVGQIAAIPGHMATLSLKNNKKVYWDAKTERVRYS
ncbi:MAG: Gfo/Idh/MocA family oxidoreductase [Bryobacterales bacterium]|nr:Gfo/Idh/MocA family oxidoreductase [Bryobacterales bacterium]